MLVTVLCTCLVLPGQIALGYVVIQKLNDAAQHATVFSSQFQPLRVLR